MTRAERIELAAYRLIAILYPNGKWVGTRYIHEDNKGRDAFCSAASQLNAALLSPNIEENLDK